MPPFCGCCFFRHNVSQYLPQVSLKAHATILSSAARTILTQTFVNPSASILHEVSYQFPLYDGVSVVGFQCRVGSRLLHSKVKSKEQANADYEHAVANNQTAAILDHSSTQGDVFLTRLGNVPANETITVEITFVGELKQDSQMDGIRYTLPNTIAPRYHNVMLFSPGPSLSSGFSASQQGIEITVDVQMEKTSKIRQIHSPSHSVTVSIGQTSTPEIRALFDPSRASATLRLSQEIQAVLERDFVLVVKADGLDNPRALLESHPTIPGQRALMATLVPKFNLLPAKPEIIFVIDRSGSMHHKISTLKTALGVFLKSLPVGVCFNICSFGFSHELLWPSSRVYDASSLKDALFFVETIGANMGGTELLPAVEGAVESRLKERDLEVLILTDGQIADQQSLFAVIRSTAANNSARFFSLGIGDAASHSLIEGIARAGNGVSQSVLQYEDLDRKVVRMLKGALTPHIYDCKLQVEYEPKGDDDFEVLSEADLSSQASSTETETETAMTPEKPTTQLISFFEENFQESDSLLGIPPDTHEPCLPTFPAPKFLQAPYKMPPLYSFLRTTVYLLIDPSASDKTPQSLKFSASSRQGPLGLRIPITNVGRGETIHQLASRKAVVELEEEHGWLQDASDDSGNAFWQLHPDTKEQLVARECQSLGVKYQVTGKYCSFVALEGADSSSSTESSEARVLYPQTNAWEITPPGLDSASLNFLGLCVDADASQPPPYHHSGSRAVKRANFASAAPSGAMSAAQSGGLFGSARGDGATLYIPPGARPVGWSPPCRGGAMSSTPPPMLGGFCGSSAQLPSPRRWFGNADSNQPTSGGSLFGSAAPANSTSGGLFGNSTSRPTIGGLAFSCAAPAQPGQQSLFDTLSATGNSNAPTPNPAPTFARSNLFAGVSTTSKRSRKAHVAGEPQLTPAPAKTYPSTVHALVDMQVFTGNWEWTAELFDTLGRDMLEMTDKVTKLLPDIGDNGSLQLREANVVATLLVMGFLERKHAQQKGVWELVYGKADEWVRSTLAQMGSLGQSIGARKAAIMALV